MGLGFGAGTCRRALAGSPDSGMRVLRLAGQPRHRIPWRWQRTMDVASWAHLLCEGLRAGLSLGVRWAGPPVSLSCLWGACWSPCWLREPHRSGNCSQDRNEACDSGHVGGPWRHQSGSGRPVQSHCVSSGTLVGLPASGAGAGTFPPGSGRAWWACSAPRLWPLLQRGLALSSPACLACGGGEPAEVQASGCTEQEPGSRGAAASGF